MLPMGPWRYVFWVEAMLGSEYIWIRQAVREVIGLQDGSRPYVIRKKNRRKGPSIIPDQPDRFCPPVGNYSRLPSLAAITVWQP